MEKETRKDANVAETIEEKKQQIEATDEDLNDVAGGARAQPLYGVPD